MPAIAFKNRFVFDRYFFEDFKAGRFNTKPSILKMLMYVNDRAREHKRTHNVMSKKIFDEITQNPNMVREVLRCSFYDSDTPQIEEIPDEVERTIKLAIDLLEEEPHRTIIFTSDEKIEAYKKNPHFNGVKEISVKSGKEALVIITDYFQQCTGA